MVRVFVSRWAGLDKARGRCAQIISATVAMAPRYFLFCILFVCCGLSRAKSIGAAFNENNDCSITTANYSLTWAYDELSNDVVFKLSIESDLESFWTGIAFGQQRPDDVIEVFVRSGQIGLVDGHISDGEIEADDMTNVQALGFDYQDGKLMAQFARPLNTGDGQDVDLSHCVNFYLTTTARPLATGVPVELVGEELQQFRVCDLAVTCAAQQQSEIVKRDDDPPVCEHRGPGALNQISWAAQGDTIHFTLQQNARKGRFWTVVGVGESMENIDSVIVFAENGRLRNQGMYSNRGYGSPRKNDEIASLLHQENNEVVDGKATIRFSVDKAFFTDRADSQGCIPLQIGILAGNYKPNFNVDKHERTPTAVLVCGIERCGGVAEAAPQPTTPNEEAAPEPTTTPAAEAPEPTAPNAQAEPEATKLNAVEAVEPTTTPAAEAPEPTTTPAAEAPEPTTTPAVEAPEPTTTPAAEAPEPTTTSAAEAPEPTTKTPAAEAPELTTTTPAAEAPEPTTTPAAEAPEPTTTPAAEAPEPSRPPAAEAHDFTTTTEVEAPEPTTTATTPDLTTPTTTPRPEPLKEVSEHQEEPKNATDLEGSGAVATTTDGKRANAWPSSVTKVEVDGEVLATKSDENATVTAAGAGNGKDETSTLQPKELSVIDNNTNTGGIIAHPPAKGCGKGHEDLDVCEGYFSEYLGKVSDWSDRHKMPMSTHMWKACTLLSQVQHVPTMCCTIFRNTCATYLDI